MPNGEDTYIPPGPSPWQQAAAQEDASLRTWAVTWAGGYVELLEAHYWHVPEAGGTPWRAVRKKSGGLHTILAAAAPLIVVVRDITDGESFGGLL